MLKIEVSETTLNDLKIFLSRTDLKGAEVPAYAEVMKSIYNATPVNKLKEEVVEKVEEVEEISKEKVGD